MAHRTRAETLGQEGRYRRTSSPPTGAKHSNTLPHQGQQAGEFLDLPSPPGGGGGPLSTRQQEFHQSLLLGGDPHGDHHGPGQLGGSALNLGGPTALDSSNHMSLGATGRTNSEAPNCSIGAYSYH